MVIKKILLLFVALLIFFLFVTCKETERTVPQEKEVAIAKLQSPSLSWEEDWNKTIKASKREGKLIIYSGSNPELREALSKAFMERFGIAIEHIPGTASQLAAKIISEYKANIFYADIYSGGVSTTLTMLKPAGILTPLDPVLVLPEVLELKLWYEGKIPFVDQMHTTVVITLAPAVGFIINTNLVMQGEMKSYQDLLKPKWKGKIILANPTMPPGGDIWFTAYVYGGVLSLDYMKTLASQEPFISRDRRQAAEWLARGKYSISLATGWSNFEEFDKAGMPIKPVISLEGDYLTAGAGAIGLMKNPPHPNAAKVYINWLLSKEGATVASRGYDKHSTRLDVPTEGLTQFKLRQPAIKYIEGDTEEIYSNMSKYRKMAEEIFGHLLR